MTANGSQVTTGGDIGETTDFKIAQTSEMFMILSSGIYTDKIKAVVRELSTNAFDAHKLADTLDKPFKVHLPTQLEPYFAVRDYGVGLSHDDIVNLYSTYGVSTKSDSNDFVGAMGLGSKSPFAYTTSFMVTSYFNGEVKSYSCYIESGTPRVTLMDSDFTTEENGLEVRMNVLTTDISNFKHKAENIYQWFSYRPEVNISLNYIENSAILEGIGWKLLSNYVTNDNSGACVKMGDIIYPIQQSAWEHSSIYYTLAGQNILIDVNLGDVMMAADRESLSMTKDTTKFIEDSFDKIIEKSSKGISDEVNKLTTIWEQRVVFNKLYNELPYALRSNMKVEIDGKNVTNPIYLNVKNFVNSDKALFSVVKYGGWRKSGVVASNWDSFTIEPKGSYEFLVADQRIGSVQVAQELRGQVGSGWGASNKNTVILLKPNSLPITKECRDEMDKFLSDLGKPKYQVVSDLYVKPVRVKSTSKDGNKTKLTKTEIKVRRFELSSHRSPTDLVVQHTQEIWYVPMYSRNVSYDFKENTKINHEVLIKAVNLIREEKGESAIASIDGINSGDKEEVKHFSNAINVIDYIKENIDLVKFMDKDSYYDMCNDFSSGVVSEIMATKLFTKDSVAHKIASFVTTNGYSDKYVKNLSNMASVKIMGIELKLTQVKVPKWYTSTIVRLTYALLGDFGWSFDRQPMKVIQYLVMQDMYNKKINKKEKLSETTH